MPMPMKPLLASMQRFGVRRDRAEVLVDHLNQRSVLNRGR